MYLFILVAIFSLPPAVGFPPLASYLNETFNHKFHRKKPESLFNKVTGLDLQFHKKETPVHGVFL